MLQSFLIPLLINFFLPHPSFQSDRYQCLPCGQDCDKMVYNKPGTCGSCHMELVKTNSISFRNMPPEMVCDYIRSHPKIVLLDVRSGDEFNGRASPDFGTLKNAINIPVQELPARIKELEAYKNREVLVYCSHSHRSPRASYLLTQNGFTQVINMLGGMSVFKGPCKK